MGHHGGVHTRKCTAVEQHNLAATAFLCRGSDHLNGQTDLISHACGCNAGAERHSGDDIMSAGMTNSGETIVFGTNSQVERPIAGFGNK